MAGGDIAVRRIRQYRIRVQKLLGSGIAAVALALSSARAQQPGSVSGTVYDSVGRAPLEGAIVQMVPAAGTGLFSATTDARGRYSIAGAPPGRYVIGFQHYVLDSLALEPPVGAVQVRASENVVRNLAVPAPSTIVRLACRTTPADSVGFFFGVLTSARTRGGLDSGRVTVRWFDIVIDSSGVSHRERTLHATTAPDGWFGLCGMPAGAEVVVRAHHSTDSTGLSLVHVPSHGLKRFDLALGGRATVRGRVTSQGMPVANARVIAVGEDRGVHTDTLGHYRLAMAAGTQTVEVRALGYVPGARDVTLSPDSETLLEVELTTVDRLMDTIRIVAQRVNSVDLEGFERRRRTTDGVFFDAETARRRAPFSVFQLLREVPSLRIEGLGLERRILMRAGDSFFGGCSPAFFLNGIQMPAELLVDLDVFVLPEELQGMEVYRGTNVPGEFRNFTDCGAVVVWTKRPPVLKR